ncbi:hypothetical protein HYE37_02375 [Mycoplasmopsis bovis]|nr:hypothetical protein [Mycoplasmopsis bovis]QQH21334.1 hypothetical protein HYE37_02375 [Mycoplasmopsis bovis]
MVLVILLQILTHKFKIIKTTKKIILKKKNNSDDPRDLLEPTWKKFEIDYEKTEKENAKLNKKLKLLWCFK